MEFKRYEGLFGSIPRKWIDSNLPKCPFCNKPSLWEFNLELREKETTFERVFGQIPQKWYKAYHFRCPNCHAIIAVLADAIKKMPVMYEGSIFPGIIKLGKQIEHKQHEKDWDGNVFIESVGNNSDKNDIIGKEILLKTLQEWIS